jgi:hypothetical protein
MEQYERWIRFAGQDQYWWISFFEYFIPNTTPKLLNAPAKTTQSVILQECSQFDYKENKTTGEFNSSPKEIPIQLSLFDIF